MHERSKRPSTVPLRDIRGSFVRRIETAQTFLTPSEADRLIGEYNVGMSVQGPAKKYGIRRATVSAHLSRLGTPRRRLGLDVDECAEAVRLFRAGTSMCTIARRSGIGLKAVRDALFQANFVQEEGPKSR